MKGRIVRGNFSSDREKLEKNVENMILEALGTFDEEKWISSLELWAILLESGSMFPNQEEVFRGVLQGLIFRKKVVYRVRNDEEEVKLPARLPKAA